ncbi:hypothetical protein DTW90_25635 [Neorhizobium sp. P12A]|uniref:hypothetical protein n=1 Tax=Rhizobium/Agrobacterium group TaxID=227290 RepID=UPI0010438B83|nr:MULTISPECIES: hypothetical protein [Rhizobium/Agrobacterium group]KAA0693755.1 hypothetical protein DTW90_25635 [Neorhizobium sp. P12A]TCR80803.1 hypothetical protein EV561_11380 [Rhizobium sp. BK376]
MRLPLAVLLMAMACTVQSPTRASEWGCEVLLCAASDNPAWQAVATCRPPMERLIDAMKQPGFSWPTCPEGGAGKPGYDRYADCPAGWTPSVADVDSDHGSSDLSRCRRVVDQCARGAARAGRDGADGRIVDDAGITRAYSQYDSCHVVETMARPLRDKPYFFDIEEQDGSGSARQYFSLDR